MESDKIAMLVLSGIVVLGFGSVLIAWMIFPPQSNSNLLSAMVGSLAAGYMQVISYWFSKARA
jgi:hypothetical protein